MPVLMVALLALGVFAGIGVLLTTAVILQTRGKSRHVQSRSIAAPQGK